MAYDFTIKQLEQWDWPAQAEAYRQKYLNAERNAAYWKARAEHDQMKETNVETGS